MSCVSKRHEMMVFQQHHLSFSMFWKNTVNFLLVVYHPSQITVSQYSIDTICQEHMGFPFYVAS